MDFTELLKIAINASIKGGEAIMQVYDSEFVVEKKSDTSPKALNPDLTLPYLIKKLNCYIALIL